MATNNEQPNLFERGAVQTARKKKIMISSLIIVAVAVLATVSYFMLTANREKPVTEELATQTKEEVAMEMKGLEASANSVSSEEESDKIIERTDEILEQTSDLEQKFKLFVIQAQTYSMSKQYDQAVAVFESMLDMPDWSEEQRLRIYVMLAETYRYEVRDIQQFRKYIELIENSSALVTDRESEDFVNVDYYKKQLKIQEEEAANE
ncbi:MAG: hypothetical protein LBQ02_01315 [Candidatus Nomurabacteria bacterium]|jgi:uncharacterized membrane-anchored protein|nr:hypothetical protein [Candidatus Nomurabacteria bacterium]